MKSIYVILGAVIWSSTLSAQGFDEHIRTSHVPPSLAGPSDLQSQTFTQAIDHSSAKSSTFAQRYWVDSQYASGPDAPVIYHMCGEGDVEESYFLTDAVIEWAQQLGARVVFLEHRYYGQSLPFDDFTTEHLRYLTLDNVMEDLATFQKWLSTQQGWTGKWIAVGGSYSGTMAALYRQKHPELVVGALASSAPMISGKGNIISNANDLEGDPWSYQGCTQLGYWQADSADITGNLEIPSQAACAEAFPGAPFASYQFYNQTYDQPFLASGSCSPSNILFTYGSNDVWTNLGLVEQTNNNSGVTISMIQGAGHHFDLNAPSSDDTAAVIAARNLFITLAKQWLN